MWLVTHQFLDGGDETIHRVTLLFCELTLRQRPHILQRVQELILIVRQPRSQRPPLENVPQRVETSPLAPGIDEPGHVALRLLSTAHVRRFPCHTRAGR